MCTEETKTTGSGDRCYISQPPVVERRFLDMKWRGQGDPYCADTTRMVREAVSNAGIVRGVGCGVIVMGSTAGRQCCGRGTVGKLR